MWVEADEREREETDSEEEWDELFRSSDESDFDGFQCKRKGGFEGIEICTKFEDLNFGHTMHETREVV